MTSARNASRRNTVLNAAKNGSRKEYSIGAALKVVRPFDGATGADCAAYIMELTHLMPTFGHANNAANCPSSVWGKP